MNLTKNQKRNILFLLLYTEYGKKQDEIAEFLQCQQSTVSIGIKEARYLLTIKEAKMEIKQLREVLNAQIGAPKSIIPKDIS